jgi:hypothetical protein
MLSYFISNSELGGSVGPYSAYFNAFFFIFKLGDIALQTCFKHLLPSAIKTTVLPMMTF